MTQDDIYQQIEALFEANYQRLQAEGGHPLTEDLKQLARNQVQFYYQKLADIAHRVTDTEVHLSLPNQRTPAGRPFTIEGVVDIVREDEETWMYDIKTHDPEFVERYKPYYEKQLNVYAFIWEGLRQQALDHTAVISTAFPRALKQAKRNEDMFAIMRALTKWDPVVPVDLDRARVEETIEDFGQVVDQIEAGEFAPASLEQLEEKLVGNRNFASRVCRRCDARFSCESYRSFATQDGRRDFSRYFDEYGGDEEQEAWVQANLERGSSAADDND